ncbi:LacI family DNA-binding transcriptional regulator [Rathayibacter sp. AY1D3]|uniref:LacI family DNA-binding transcriptional regulator n=1 Tax=Rathayibacter sp. AY1D3 TaxID=2080544 RepID=UPI000CE73040|nr:LacI family DNA-binding transcriptional regulator [Rathayibacter sp. AY1D3]PPH88944.1 LacI family transcriptional regulator [Rathayibacter sp. AY1D3]
MPSRGRGGTPSRPTIQDVAVEAGVSRGTVSRVLNGGRWVSPEAHARVEAAITRTGYRANPHARSLSRSRTDTVAFLLTEDARSLFEDPNFATLLRGASAALAEHDVALVLILAGTEHEQRRALAYIDAGHVDGVLLISAHVGARLLTDIQRSSVPAIACGVPVGYEKRMGCVAADDEEGAREMVAHLRSLGRSRIATIAGPPDTTGGIARLAGYRAEVGGAEAVEFGDYGRAGGATAMEALLAAHPDIDAVFAANDRMAAGAIDALARLGKRVPEDVAVGGFDDSAVALTTDPPLTTMRQPFERISAEMVRLLLQAIEGERPAAITLPTDLVRRGSTQPGVSP